MFEFTYSPYAIPNFIVAMYTLLLGSFVLLKPKKKTILHVSFFFMSFTFFIWLGNYMLCYLSTDEIQALFWARNAYIGIVFIGVATHHLFVSLLKRNKKDRFQVRLSYVLGFIFLGLSRTEVFFSRAYKYFWGYYPKGATWLYSVFLVFFFWFFIRTFIVTTKELIRYKKDNLPGYQNLKILFTAVAIALIGAIDYIAKYGIEFYPFGYVFILIWLNMVAYTIIKYKVFDIETIIHKTLLWLVMSTLVIAPLGGIIYFAYPYLQDRGPFLIAVFAIFLFILMLVYYNKIQPVIDQLFQRKKHDYRKILEEFLAKISTLNNITKLMDSTDDVIKKTLYTEKIEYFLVGNEGAVIPYKSKKFTGPLQAGESVLKWLQKEKDVVEIDVIISDPRYVKIKENMMGLFEEIDAEILVPVVHNDKLLGMMGLSKKKNMKNYTDLDIKFLKDLSMELGIALANSLMFETVNRQNVELKELDKLKNEFLANTSHELRTPLNGIIGLAEAMYEGADGKVNDKMTKHLGMITNSAKSLRNLVSDILDLSKMQSGKQEFEISRISIEKVMEDVRPVIEGLVIDKPIKVEFDIKKGLPDVFIDRGKIKQVMINLIGNAVKFTSKGSVRISARSYDKKDGYIQVSVQDTGIGMKKEDLKVIFDEFRQADGSATRSFEGTGLGLAITKKIVTAHTGTIWAESTLGKGSTLHFTLSTKEFKEVSVFKEEKEPEYFPAGPMEKEDITVERRKKERDFDPSIKGFLAEEEYKSEDLKRYPKGKGEKLLIVDDIEVNLESLALSLQGKGYKVSKALSAKDALKLLKSGNYNLIISDVMMPDMDGYQLVEKIKASDKLVKIPVILLTA
ncbi:MAG: response regulator, partial [Spirochaetes bacterium]|nr:response regulator [Spirochaetota bacterium]